MSRRKEPPRLWLKPAEPKRDARPARVAVWCIVDGAKRISTGCGERDIVQAQQKLADHIKAKFEPPTGLGGCLLVVECIAAYLKEHVAQLESAKSREHARHTARPILEWWSGKKISEVNGTNCRKYVKWRTSQGRRTQTSSGKSPTYISDQTARHDLKTLRAALRWYKREVDSAIFVPTVTLPSKAPRRADYWLTRDEIAARIRVARRNRQTHHVARLLLIGCRTGTRPGALLGLRWIPSTTSGWFDLENGVLYRRGSGIRQTNKRQPPAKIHASLLPHLRRWRERDMKQGITSVVHYLGEPITKLRRSWDTVAKLAGAKRKDGPHVLRHTCITWLMRHGVDVYEVSGYTGVSVEVLLETYAHHHPAFQSKAATATGKRR
jgi:integrase